MLEGPNEFLWIGFAISCVGFGALNYANLTMRWHYRNLDWRRMTRAEYWSLVKERWAWPWPFYAAAICIPVGIIVTFSAIVYNNHVKLR
jgi:hypothetical protein